MKTIEAFKCEHTGNIFERPRDAALSEFRALMKRVAMSMSSPPGGAASTEIVSRLTAVIEGEVYPAVPDQLRAALDYFDANIRRKTFESIHDGHMPEGPAS